MSKVRQTFIDAVTKLGKETITTDDIKNIMVDTGIAHPYWFTNQKDLREVVVSMMLRVCCKSS